MYFDLFSTSLLSKKLHRIPENDIFKKSIILLLNNNDLISKETNKLRNWNPSS